jgi:hypothetical protein
MTALQEIEKGEFSAMRQTIFECYGGFIKEYGIREECKNGKAGNFFD